MTDLGKPSDLERLARNLGRGGGRYALYPPPRSFRPFSDARFCAAIRDSNGDPIPTPLALHFDIPASYRTSFCGNESGPRPADGSRAEAYAHRLIREIGLTGSLFDRDRDVVHVSLAPGMARWVSAAQMDELLSSLDRHFHLRPTGGLDLAMTVEPDRTPVSPLRDWASLGFNRVSIGMGSLLGADTPLDQRSVRLQATVDALREAGFANLRIELPYGLPHQGVEAFEAMLSTVIEASPERVGLRNCAAYAEVTPAATNGLSTTTLQARMLLSAADRLTDAGYLHVGLDVFARPNDALVRAQRRSHLYRDTLGFGVHGPTDLIGFGVGAISQLGGCHAQNPLDLSTWEARLDQGQRPIDHGIELDADDRVRASILQEILCQGEIAVREVEARFGLDFKEAFAGELAALAPLFEEGSLSWEDGRLSLDRIARLSARAVASAFDRHSWANLGVPQQIRASG
jgi:oxygen-independent coproporphyrinogen-3 oxidase